VDAVEMQDVVIVGGGVAGLSAALFIGRLRRRAGLFDTGEPCNRFSGASHGFLSRDGIVPAELVEIGRDQLRRYATVELRAEAVTRIAKDADGFVVEGAMGALVKTRYVLLATGMRDVLPLIPGIEAFWGQSVFHCYYCDGWEERDQPIAIYGNGAFALNYVRFLLNLTDDLTICTDGPAAFSDAEHRLLQTHHVHVVETRVERFTGEGGQLACIVLADGTTLARRTLFVRPQVVQHSDLAAQLGCELTDTGHVRVDASGQTSVSGVYAAGDMTSESRHVVTAAAQGAEAAKSINLLLATHNFERQPAAR